jgi:hypothetical protein
MAVLMVSCGIASGRQLSEVDLCRRLNPRNDDYGMSVLEGLVVVEPP